MTAFRALYDQLFRLYYAAMLCTGVTLLAVVSWGVFKRYVMGAPLTWGYELSIVLYMWTGFLGMAVAYERGLLRSITFIMDAVKNAWVRHITEIVVLSVCVVALSIGAYQGFGLFLKMWPRSLRTLDLSLGWQYLPTALCFATMALTSLVRLVEHFVHWPTSLPEDDPA